MNPAERVIKKFGLDIPELAKRLGRDRTRVWRWTQPIEKGGTGGKIPHQVHESLFKLAKEMGVKLKAEDLIDAGD